MSANLHPVFQDIIRRHAGLPQPKLCECGQPGRHVCDNCDAGICEDHVGGRIPDEAICCRPCANKSAAEHGAHREELHVYINSRLFLEFREWTPALRINAGSKPVTGSAPLTRAEAEALRDALNQIIPRMEE